LIQIGIISRYSSPQGSLYHIICQFEMINFVFVFEISLL